VSSYVRRHEVVETELTRQEKRVVRQEPEPKRWRSWFAKLRRERSAEDA